MKEKRLLSINLPGLSYDMLEAGGFQNWTSETEMQIAAMT